MAKSQLYLLTKMHREHGIRRLRITVKRREDNHILNCSWDAWMVDDPQRVSAVADLRLETYFGDDNRPYGLEAGYGDVFHIDQHRATVMAATLKAINKRLAREETRDSGDLYVAFARAVGAVGSVRETGTPSFDLRQGKWVFETLAEGRTNLRRLLADEEAAPRQAA